MGSRIRENVKRFFECFCEVVPPTGDTEPWIIQQFPEKYKDLEVLRTVPKFAYPYKFDNDVIQHYSFVLTDIESKWTFGFCRHDPKSETALVVLSYLPWHQGFYKFLDTTAVLMHSSRTEDLREFLSAVYNAKILEPGGKFLVSFNRGDSTFSVDVPRPFQLPSIPENRNLTEYFNAVDSHNMMVIFASMLYERRIIFTSTKLKRLSACVQSANDIIYPMIWQHIFIPVLPMSLIDYLLAPMPFLIGVPEAVFKQVRRSEIGDVVILDADSNKIESPFDDLNSLPQEVVSFLKKQFKNKQLGDGVSRAFLRALVQLIGGYRDALKFQPGQKVTFDEERFIETRPPSLQPFLREMLHLQIFQQISDEADVDQRFEVGKFIEERLMMLNTGQGFSDEFEFELEGYSAKSGSKLKQQYKEWTSTMKKEGSAFFKSVKDKANPAMKSAVKTVKDGGKGVRSAYKGLRSKLKDSPGGQQVGNGVEHRSAPNSPTGKRRTAPAGFGPPAATYRKEGKRAVKSGGGQRSYSPLSPSSQPVSPDSSDTPRSSSPIEIPQIDLMDEMDDLFQLRLDMPPIDRTLKPVRSLENFKTAPARFFPPHLGGSQETRNLLRSPPDDAFASPPPSVPPRADLYGGGAGFVVGGASFVVGGGRGENGEPLFYVADRHSVDLVKLSPPVCSPRRKKNEESEDLIRLDSTSDMDDFDPLKSSSSTTTPGHSDHLPLSITNPLYSYENHTPKREWTSKEDASQWNLKNEESEDLIRLDSTSDMDDFDPLKSSSSTTTPGHSDHLPLSITNPLYSYENHTPKREWTSKECSRKDRDLLEEYGLDFSFTSVPNQNGLEPFSAAAKVNLQGQWTKFEWRHIDDS